MLGYTDVDMRDVLLAPPVAVLKVGSTSISVLVARCLDHPLWQASFDVGLLTAPNPGEILAHTLATIIPELRRLDVRNLLTATGEVGRVRPECAETLRRHGLHPWILTGDEEARVSWWGEQGRHAGPVWVIDVGGGSTELVGPARGLSLAFGAQQPTPPAHADRLLRDLQGKMPHLVAAGGTARVAARVLGSMQLSRATLSELASGASIPDELREALNISELRARLLPGGASVLKWVMETAGISAVDVSPRDLRHGLWLAATLGRARRWDG